LCCGSALADSDEFGFDGDSASDFDVYNGFEGDERAGFRSGEAGKEVFDGILAADEFGGGLRAEGCGSGEDEDGVFGRDAGNESDDGVVFD
jgi:hypothetical protein